MFDIQNDQIDFWKVGKIRIKNWGEEFIIKDFYKMIRLFMFMAFIYVYTFIYWNAFCFKSVVSILLPHHQ